VTSLKYSHRFTEKSKDYSESRDLDYNFPRRRRRQEPLIKSFRQSHSTFHKSYSESRYLDSYNLVGDDVRSL
jgi:hypothetical protein